MGIGGWLFGRKKQREAEATVETIFERLYQLMFPGGAPDVERLKSSIVQAVPGRVNSGQAEDIALKVSAVLFTSKYPDTDRLVVTLTPLTPGLLEHERQAIAHAVMTHHGRSATRDTEELEQDDKVDGDKLAEDIAQMVRRLADQFVRHSLSHFSKNNLLPDAEGAVLRTNPFETTYFLLAVVTYLILKRIEDSAQLADAVAFDVLGRQAKEFDKPYRDLVTAYQRRYAEYLPCVRACMESEGARQFVEMELLGRLLVNNLVRRLLKGAGGVEESAVKHADASKVGAILSAVMRVVPLHFEALLERID